MIFVTKTLGLTVAPPKEATVAEGDHELAPGALDVPYDPWSVQVPAGQHLPAGTAIPYKYEIKPPLKTCIMAQALIGQCVGASRLDNPTCLESATPLQSRMDILNSQRDLAAMEAMRADYFAKTGQNPVFIDYSPMVYAAQEGVEASTDIIRYMLYPNDPVPAEMLNPPPFGASDPRAPALQAASLLFYPRGYFDFGGKTPGRFHPTKNIGSYLGPDQPPFLYWYPLISEEMINQAVDFLKAGGFGPEAGPHADTLVSDMVAAGTQLGKLGVSLSKAIGGPGSAEDDAKAVAGTAAAAISAASPVVGAAIGAGIALFSVFEDIFASDPDPPAWVKRLAQMDDIASKTGGFYWVGAAPPFTLDTITVQRSAAGCNRFWPVKKAKYNILDGYAQVMCRLAGQQCAMQAPPDDSWKKWLWIGAAVLGGGILLNVLGSKRKVTTPTAPTT